MVGHEQGARRASGRPSAGPEIMSKIYEALKKAHGERAQDPPVAKPHAHEEAKVATIPQKAPVVPVIEPQKAPDRPTHAPGITGQYLRFDDLLKQCAEPVWQPDPNMIVFSDRHSPHQGAEQFRTLRARLYQMRDVSPLKKVLVTSALAA